MMTGVCGYDGKTYTVWSPTCEVVTEMTGKSWREWKLCGAPTTHFYPTHTGTFALCHEHAQQHLPHGAWPVSEQESVSAPAGRADGGSE